MAKKKRLKWWTWLLIITYLATGVFLAILTSTLGSIGGNKPPLWQSILTVIAWPLQLLYIAIIKRITGT